MNAIKSFGKEPPHIHTIILKNHPLNVIRISIKLLSVRRPGARCTRSHLPAQKYVARTHTQRPPPPRIMQKRLRASALYALVITADRNRVRESRPKVEQQQQHHRTHALPLFFCARCSSPSYSYVVIVSPAAFRVITNLYGGDKSVTPLPPYIYYTSRAACGRICHKRVFGGTQGAGKFTESLNIGYGC